MILLSTKWEGGKSLHQFSCEWDPLDHWEKVKQWDMALTASGHNAAPPRLYEHQRDNGLDGLEIRSVVSRKIDGLVCNTATVANSQTGGQQQQELDESISCKIYLLVMVGKLRQALWYVTVSNQGGVLFPINLTQNQDARWRKYCRINTRKQQSLH